MLHVPPPSPALDAAPTDPREDARALAAEQMAMLRVLARIGMDVAEAVGRQARATLTDDVADVEAGLGADGAAAPKDEDTTAPGAPAFDDLGLAYARVSRAVRLTIALQNQLLRGLEGRARDAEVAHRERVVRLVERALETENDDADEVEDLSDEVRERLRDQDDWGSLLALPLAEAVGRICKDLGLAPDWGALFEGVADLRAEDEMPDPPGSSPDPSCGWGEVARSAGGGGRALRSASDSAPKPPSRPSAVLPPLPSGIGGRA